MKFYRKKLNYSRTIVQTIIIDHMETISTYRYIKYINTQLNIAEIHVFTTHSKMVTVYKIKFKLLCSKSRVSYLKTISIPRLELYGILVIN